MPCWFICCWGPWECRCSRALTAAWAICWAPPGGYIVGFVLSALVMWGMEALPGKKTWVLALSMVLGLAVCYAFGTAWFMVVYARNSGPIGLATALGWCVIPYIVPDLVKIALALLLQKLLFPAIRLR